MRPLEPNGTAPKHGLFLLLTTVDIIILYVGPYFYFKYVLIIDTDLRFKPYITSLLKKVFLALRNLFKNKFVLSFKVKRVLSIFNCR